MADLEWQGDGPVFTTLVDGRPWRLDLDSARPGLAWSESPLGARLLGLDHVAAVGRRDESAFDAVSLDSFERHRGRVQAIFAPAGWRGLKVRTAWAPTPDQDGFDLEVQVWSTSTGVFRRLELAVATSWSDGSAGPLNPRRWSVEPRDVHAAALSYDGREAADTLHSLTTRPVPDESPRALEPICCPIPGPSPSGPGCYLEMVRPDDCARRVIGVGTAEGDPARGGQTIRYGLFGHDLEKGVVLRGRIRGVWLSPATGEDGRRRRLEAFLSEPPALGP